MHGMLASTTGSIPILKIQNFYDFQRKDNTARSNIAFQENLDINIWIKYHNASSK